MSIQRHAAVLASLALGLSLSPTASAVLWSSTNVVGKESQPAIMEISLTGDSVTEATQVDIAMPIWVTSITVTPLNGAGCAYLSATRVVRVLDISAASGETFPYYARPVCTIQFRVMRGTSAWFPMRNAGCWNGAGEQLPAAQCTLDAGYLTYRR